MKSTIFLLLLVTLTGCAVTTTGKGYDLTEDDKVSEAIYYFEKAATQEQDKFSALMASNIYLNDYQIPRDLDKATYYFKLYESLPYREGDQLLDFYIPIVQSKILLFDEDPSNDEEALGYIRGAQYSYYSPALLILAKSYSLGRGVEPNIALAKKLYERAVDNDRYKSSIHHYAWWLAVHPSEEFRDPNKAAMLMEEIMDDEEWSNKSSSLDTMAVIRAQQGELVEAIRLQELALKRLQEESGKDINFESWRADFECHLAIYKSGQAWVYSDGDDVYREGLPKICSQ